MSKFEVDLYRRYRIPYPAQLFEGLKPYCQMSKSSLLQVLDLGAGTALASQSFLQFYPHARITLVEPDVAMLREGEDALRAQGINVECILSEAEAFSSQRQFDLVLIASAWHWMKPGPAIEALLNVLKPGGVVLVCEYQFPKLLIEHEAPDLNEWVRRQFNLHWRTETQVPRGRLSELVEPFRQNVHFSEVNHVRFDHPEFLNRETFLGVIFSQSRYLSFEQRLSLQEQKEIRKSIGAELSGIWPASSILKFNYPFQSFLYRKRNF